MSHLNQFERFWMALSAMFISYFAPIAEIVHVMLIFLVVDLISGVWASCKGGAKFESNKLRKSVLKFIWYTVAIMVSWMMEKSFNIGWSNLARFIGAFICLVELVSIFENIARITEEPVFLRIARIFRKRRNDTERLITNEDPGKAEDEEKKEADEHA